MEQTDTTSDMSVVSIIEQCNSNLFKMSATIKIKIISMILPLNLGMLFTTMDKSKPENTSTNGKTSRKLKPNNISSPIFKPGRHHYILIPYD